MSGPPRRMTATRYHGGLMMAAGGLIAVSAGLCSVVISIMAPAGKDGGSTRRKWGILTEGVCRTRIGGRRHPIRDAGWSGIVFRWPQALFRERPAGASASR